MDGQSHPDDFDDDDDDASSDEYLGPHAGYSRR